MALTIEQIRAIPKNLPKEELDVPELGGTVFVRALTLAEVNEIAKMAGGPNARDVNRRIVEMACVGDDGAPLFVGGDVKLIDQLPWSAVKAVADLVTRMNRLTPDDGEDDGLKKG